MITISADEYKQKYGDQSLAQLEAMSPLGQQQATKNSYVDRVKQAYHSGIDQTANAFNELKTETNPVKGVEHALKAESGIASAILSPITPAVAPVFDKVTNSFANSSLKTPFGTIPALSDNKNVQKFAVSKAGNVTSRVAEDLANAGNVAGGILAADQVRSGAVKTTGYAKQVMTPKPTEPGVTKPGLVKNVVNDVTPTMDRLVNHQVTQALGLTASDVKNISMKTGHEVGRFMADENLIRGNLEETKAAVSDYFKKNYETVRTEIGKVDKIYKPNQVPRYIESLKALKEKVDGVAGMQRDSVEIENLLNKKDITLNDVQRVKELIDEHTDLYKATGDVKEGIQKQGLDNVRRDLKQFVEREVKNATGADIGDLNNKVATSKGILKATEARSTAGLTKSNISGTDFGAFISGTVATGNPFVGAAAVFVKKLLQSPTVQLKIAKFFDGLSDSRKAAVVEDLQTGKIPPEFNQFIKTKNGSKGFEGPGAKNKDFGNKDVGDLQKALPELHDAVNTEGASMNIWAEADAILKKAIAGKATAKELARAKEIVNSLRMDRAGFETKPVN